MDRLLFSAFVKHATDRQVSSALPHDYRTVRELAMKKLAFPSALGHAMEIGGLGLLARPTIQEARGQQVSDRSKHVHELAGLGTLAVPSAVGLAEHYLPKAKALFQRAQQLHLPGVA